MKEGRRISHDYLKNEMGADTLLFNDFSGKWCPAFDSELNFLGGFPYYLDGMGGIVRPKWRISTDAEGVPDKFAFDDSEKDKKVTNQEAMGRVVTVEEINLPPMPFKRPIYSYADIDAEVARIRDEIAGRRVTELEMELMETQGELVGVKSELSGAKSDLLSVKQDFTNLELGFLEMQSNNLGIGGGLSDGKVVQK